MTADPNAAIEIDVDELARWRHAQLGHLVLDVREPWETALCLIAGSVIVPLAALPGAAETLPRDKPIVVVCHHGMRSLQGAVWLRRNGIENAVSLAGGIDAWASRIEPMMAKY